MARGNQRDKAREANLKKQAGQARLSHAPTATPPPAKKSTNMSGTEMQRAKESAADIMRAKQAAAEAKKNEAAAKK